MKPGGLLLVLRAALRARAVLRFLHTLPNLVAADAALCTALLHTYPARRHESRNELILFIIHGRQCKPFKPQIPRNFRFREQFKAFKAFTSIFRF